MRLALAFAALALGACRPAGPPLPPPPAPEPAPEAEADAAWSEEGRASWYGEAFHGRPTASGEPFDMEALTAAHPTLPFGTRVLVRNLDNGRDVTVRINDRGPFVDGRIIDLSRRAARELGMIDAGVARVRLTLVEGP